MAITTTDVAGIYKSGYSNHIELQPFVDTATLIVSEDLSNAGYSDDRLDQIRKYLAAHYAMLSLENGGIKKRVVEDTEEEYQSRASTKGLASTPFGVQVMSLDSSGILSANASSNLKGIFTVVSPRKSSDNLVKD